MRSEALRLYWSAVDRGELGLLRLYLLREMAWGLAMVEGLKSASLPA